MHDLRHDPAVPYFARVLHGFSGKRILEVGGGGGTLAEPLGDELFDAVLAVDVLEHVEDLDATIAACAGVLKPGGVFGFRMRNGTPDAFELAERMAAQGLLTADVHTAAPQAGYVGYAVKPRFTRTERKMSTVSDTITTTDGTAQAAPDPEHIMQVGTGFWASKTLLSAVELEVFTELGGDAITGEELGRRLGLHRRAVSDFFDALVALGFLGRDGDGDGARYRNTAETAAFLDKASPAYIGGVLEMANARLYGFWGDLTEALKTGLPQNEVKHTGAPLFEELYRDPARLEQIMRAMAGISAGNSHALAENVDFSKWETLLDVGGATGQLSCIVAERHPHLRATSFDLPPVAPIAAKVIAARGLSDRVSVASGDFFADPLPTADVITMGMILHDWNLERKMHLIRSAYDALPEGGALIVVENLIDDARRENAFGLLMSLTMLIETGDGFDYTGADFAGWCREAGFKHVDVVPLAGPASAGIAYK